MDAVIVLANLMDEKGVLNFESAARAARSVEVLRERSGNALVTCGWAYLKGCEISIADAFKDHIVSQFDVLPEMIIAERNSRDTVGDAYFTKMSLAKPRGWKSICVVTSDYHVKRTKVIFDFIYGDAFKIEVLGAEVPCSDETSLNEFKSLEAFKTTFDGVQRGNDAMILDRLRHRHPFYNGEVYSRI